MDNNMNNDDFNKNSQPNNSSLNGEQPQSSEEIPFDEYKNIYSPDGHYGSPENNRGQTDTRRNDQSHERNFARDDTYTYRSTGNGDGSRRYNDNYNQNGEGDFGNRYNDNYNQNPNLYSNGSPENNNGKNKKVSGLGIASMILGIVGIVLCCTVWVSLITSIIGLVFGIISMAKNRNGFALAGIITSSFGLAISVLMIVLLVIANFVSENPDWTWPEDSPGHEFAVKYVVNTLKNFIGKK